MVQVFGTRNMSDDGDDDLAVAATVVLSASNDKNNRPLASSDAAFLSHNP